MSAFGRVIIGPVRHENRALITSCVLSVLRTGAELARPWPLAIAVDYAINRRPLPTVLTAVALTSTPAGLMVAAGVATVIISAAIALLDLGANRSAERAAERIGSRLRIDLLSRALRLPLRWHAGTRSAEVVSRLTSDVGRVLDALVASTLTLIPDALAVVGVLIVLLVVDPLLAGVGLVVVPLLAVLSLRQRRRVRSSQVAARTASGRLTTSATDLLRNVLAVQAFNRADRAESTFTRHNDALLGAELVAIDVETRWRPVSDIVLGLGAALVLVVGGLQVIDGAVSTGHLLVVLSYLGDLYAPVRALTRLSGLWAKAGASAERILDVRDAETVPSAAATGSVGAPPLTGRITLEGLTFGYEPARPVLRELDLVVEAGETVCLFGPSGVGKSTVLLLLLRLYEPDAGRICIDGVDLRRYGLESLRERIAYVPQDPWLFDATLAQNVAIGSRHASRAQVIQACRAARVDEFVDRLPLGYDTPLGESAGRLSGGQRRRVALARAAISPAALLLLDEPTASLDRRSASEVITAIRAASERRTTLIVTHDPALAAIADRVIDLSGSSTSGPPGSTSTSSATAGGR